MNNEVSNWLEGFFELNPDAIEEEVVTTKKKSTLTLDMELPAMDLVIRISIEIYLMNIKRKLDFGF